MAITQVTKEILEFCQNDSIDEIKSSLSPYIEQAKSSLQKLIETESSFKATVFEKMKTAQLPSSQLYRTISAFDEELQSLQTIYTNYQDAIVDGQEVVIHIGNAIRETEYIYECGYFLNNLDSNKKGILGEIRISAENMANLQKNKELFYLSIQQSESQKDMGAFLGVRLTTYKDISTASFINQLLSAGGEEIQVDQSFAARFFTNQKGLIRNKLGRLYEQYSNFKYNKYLRSLDPSEHISWVTKGDTIGWIKNKLYSIQNKFLRNNTQISTVTSQSVKRALQTYISIYQSLAKQSLSTEDNLNESILDNDITNAVQEWAQKQFKII